MGTAKLKLNQRQKPSHGAFHSLGEFPLKLGAKATVTIDNTAADGYVIVDAVQFLLQ